MPNGFTLRESVIDQRGPTFSGKVGVRKTYSSGDHELSFLNGIEGEIGEGANFEARGERQVRGFSARLFEYAEGGFLAIWEEAPEGSECSQYAVMSGISEQEFFRVLEGIG